MDSSWDHDDVAAEAATAAAAAAAPVAAPAPHFENLIVDLNSIPSIDAVMNKVKEIVLTNARSDYPVYRFRLKTGALANIVVHPVLFTSVSVQEVNESNRFMRASAPLSKTSAEKLTRFLAAISYVMSVSPTTCHTGLLPLHQATMVDGRSVPLIDTVNLADVGTHAYRARRGMMINAAINARRQTASALCTSSLSRASDGRLYVMWMHAYLPTASIASVAPGVPPPPSDEESEKPVCGKRRGEPAASAPKGARMGAAGAAGVSPEPPATIQVVEDHPGSAESV